jgi:hypothetical protein
MRYARGPVLSFVAVLTIRSITGFVLDCFAAPSWFNRQFGGE